MRKEEKNRRGDTEWLEKEATVLPRLFHSYVYLQKQRRKAKERMKRSFLPSPMLILSNSVAKSRRALYSNLFMDLFNK